MTRLLLTLTLIVVFAFPTSGQQIPFDQLPEQTTRVPTQELAVYDATESDPAQRLKRITVETLQSGLIPVPPGIVDGQFISFVGGQFVAVPAPSGGMADGVATAGVFDSLTNQIDFTVSSPGTDFSVDVSGLGGTGFEVQHHGVTIRTDPTFINIVGAGGVTGSGTGVDIDPGIRGFTMDRIGFVTSVDFDASDFDIGRSGDDGRVAIPNTFARDNELPSAVDLSESGGDLTLTVTMPGRTDLTDTVSLPSGGGGGGTDNVISGLTLLYSSEQLLVRALKSEGGEVNSNAVTLRAPADWARANGRSGRAPDAAIPTGVARDGELPSDIDVSESGGDLTVTVTRPGRSALTDTASLPVFDLHDDVIIPVSNLANSHRFLVSAEDVTGDPNRFVTLGDTVEFIRTDVRDESVALTTSPRVFDFTGSGVTVTNNNGLVTITIPGGSGGGGADDGVIDDFEAVLNGNEIDFTITRTVGDDITEALTVGHPMRFYRSADIAYGGTNNRDVSIDQGGHVPVEGDLIIFQHNAGPGTDYSSDDSIRLAVGNTTPVDTRIQEGNALREVHLDDISRYNITAWYRGGNNFQLIFKTYQDNIGAVTAQDDGSDLVTDARTFNFVGAGVTATAAGSDVTVTIPGGGGTQAGTVEVLHDTFTTGTGVTLEGNASAWESAGMLTLTRAIVVADDPGNLRVFGSYTADGINKYFEFSIPAALFRRMNALTTAAPTNNARNSISFHIQRTTASALTGWSESILHVGRGRSSGGNDEIWFNFGGASGGPATVFRMRAELVMPGGDGGGGGSDDGVINNVTLALSGDDLSVTVGRTVGGELMDTASLSALGQLEPGDGTGYSGRGVIATDGSGSIVAVTGANQDAMFWGTTGPVFTAMQSVVSVDLDRSGNDVTFTLDQQYGPNRTDTFTLPPSAGALVWDDEGSRIHNDPQSVDCLGAGITCTADNTGIDITVPGGVGAFALSGITASANVLTGSETFLHAASGSNTPNERTGIYQLANWLTSNMNPPRAITRGPVPSVANANVSRIYADASATNNELFYRREGTETEVLLNAGNLRLGWVGFSNFIGEWHTGGRIGPERPSEIDALLHQDEESGGWRLYLRPQSINTLLGSNRNSDPTSIQLRFREETSNTLQTITLGRGAFSNNQRLYTTTTRTPGITAGGRYVMAFRRAGESSNTVLHLGDHLITIATQDHLDELQIYMEDFAVDIIEDQHTGAVTGIDAGTGIRIDDATTQTPEVNLSIATLASVSSLSSGDLIPVHGDGVGPRHITLQQFRPQILDFTQLPDFDNTDPIDDLDTFGTYDESEDRIEEISWNRIVAQLAQGPGVNSRGDGPFGVRLYTTFEGLGANATIASGDYVAMDDVSDGTNRESERIQFDDFVDEVEDEIEIGRGQLQAGTQGNTGAASFTIAEYAWVPRATSGSNDNCVLTWRVVSGSPMWRWVHLEDQTSCQLPSTWRYMTASDNPSVWVELDGLGAVTSMWESEDPPESGPALGVQEDASGTPLAGYTVVDIGLPTYAVIEALYQTRSMTERTDALACADAYVVGRGWISPGVHTLSQVNTGVPERYEPSSRQWIMRCMANPSNPSNSPIQFYLDNLRVDNGSWALP